MARKITGAEFKRFYASEDPKFWPHDAYVEGMAIEIDGVECDDVDPEKLDDAATVKIVAGTVMLSDDREISLLGNFNKWRRSQGVTVVAVEVPTERLEELRACVRQVGARVV
ncbi:hypothetical protein [Achromobacter sp. AGC39]